ncbi:MAG: hypothetical protein CMM18_03825 [Rhodospirillaceae bacterium]|nr:hypothetical protein [Rhodospirillaceae bacterium]
MVKNKKNMLLKKNFKKNYFNIIIFLILIQLLFVLFNPGGAIANESHDPYVVRNIVVDITSSSTTLARDIALNKAQRVAYSKLISRLVVSNQLNLLPEVTDEKIISMISALQIDKEKALDKRYFATFLVKFNSLKVRDFLKKNSILFSESISDTQMIIPVYEKEGAKILWDDPNIWKDEWEKLTDNQSKILPIFLPEGSLSDMATINANQAILGNEKSLSKILNKYNLKRGIIVHAVQIQDLNARLLRLHVTVKKFGDQENSINIQSFSMPTINTEKNLLEESVKKVYNNIIEDWKLRNIIRFDNPNKVSVSILSPDIFYYNKILSLIKKTRIVENIDIIKINRNQSQIIIHFYGNKDQLLLSLERNNIKLFKENDFWNISIIQN